MTFLTHISKRIFQTSMLCNLVYFVYFVGGITGDSCQLNVKHFSSGDFYAIYCVVSLSRLHGRLGVVKILGVAHNSISNGERGILFLVNVEKIISAQIRCNEIPVSLIVSRNGQRLRYNCRACPKRLQNFYVMKIIF